MNISTVFSEQRKWSTKRKKKGSKIARKTKKERKKKYNIYRSRTSKNSVIEILKYISDFR